MYFLWYYQYLLPEISFVKKNIYLFDFSEQACYMTNILYYFRWFILYYILSN